MNGLQSLPQWEAAFGFPTGGKLGLLNAIQVSLNLRNLGTRGIIIEFTFRISVLSPATHLRPTCLMALDAGTQF